MTPLPKRSPTSSANLMPMTPPSALRASSLAVIAMRRGQVVSRKRDNEGLLVGRKHRIPNLDSCVYTVRWADGEEEDFHYNQIAEHIFSQHDEEGNWYQLFKDIVDHRKTKSAVEKANQFRDQRWKKVTKKTMAG